jgi:hypothetical protein
MLTCDCGARFEVDEALAGQEVACPECQQPVKVPPREKLPPRTSGYALASVVVALVGALTPATLLAVVLGFVALVSISRNRDRLTGSGFAVMGIVLGLVFGAVTLFAFSQGELFGLGGWMRERSLAGQIETGGSLEVSVADSGFALTRPSVKWATVPAGHVDDASIAYVQKDLDLLLVQPARYAFLDVRRVSAVGLFALESWREQVIGELEVRQRRGPVAPDDDEAPRLPARALVRQSRRLPTTNGLQGWEMALDVGRWHYVVRLYRKGNIGAVYMVRGYAPARQFPQAEDELFKGMDSFRLLGGG